MMNLKALAPKRAASQEWDEDNLRSSEQRSQSFHASQVRAKIGASHSYNELTPTTERRQSFGSLGGDCGVLSDFMEPVLFEKREGKAAYNQGKFQKARDHYRAGLAYFLSLKDVTGDLGGDKLLNTNTLEIFKEININLALSEIQLKDYDAAVDSLSCLIEYTHSDKNLQVKALYLKGKCLKTMKQHEESLECLKQALLLKPNDVNLSDYT